MFGDVAKQWIILIVIHHITNVALRGRKFVEGHKYGFYNFYVFVRRVNKKKMEIQN